MLLISKPLLVSNSFKIIVLFTLLCAGPNVMLRNALASNFGEFNFLDSNSSTPIENLFSIYEATAFFLFVLMIAPFFQNKGYQFAVLILLLTIHT